jgi:hypothetical protein
MLPFPWRCPRCQSIRARRLWVAAVAFLFLTSLCTAEAQAAGSLEYRVKAAFLYNFAKFIDWPPEALGAANQPFNICVLDDESVKDEVERTVAGKSLDTHPIVVVRVNHTEGLRVCQVFFVTAAATSQEQTFLAAVRDSSVLTVGESPGFCQRGGIINFWIEADHVRFEINPKAAERARLHPSSQLLRLARVVGDSPQAGRSRSLR